MHFLGQGLSHLNLPLGNFQEKVDPPVEHLKSALRQREALMIARKFICPSSWGSFWVLPFPVPFPSELAENVGGTGCLLGANHSTGVVDFLSLSHCN